VDSICTNEIEEVLLVDSDTASVMSTIISSQPRGSVNEWHRIHPPEALQSELPGTDSGDHERLS
jgi:hypothetical protein